MSPESILMGLTLFISIITGVIIITRKLSQIEMHLNLKIDTENGKTKKLIYIESEKTKHDFGETVAAIRKHADLAHVKIQEVELYIRDHFVEFETFTLMLGKVEKMVETIDKKLDKLMRPSEPGHTR